MNEIDEYLNDVQVAKISEKDIQMLEEGITVEELGKTLQKLSNNRSPGSDGFPYEFFKVFWIDIKHFVHRSLTNGIATGKLSITQREGHITLVPKPSKPRNLITSWRPITLLNSTYKILSATIANRLKQILSKIIHTDQTAFLKERFIGENTRIVYDVLWETFRRKDKKGMLLSVDFQTAFDVMSWEFIERCLLKFGCGEKFIQMFWCLHNNTFSRIIYNGHASKERIKLERGCRQGDPLSCYLFIIGAEILASKVRQNDKVQGIKLQKTYIKLIQYADDTTFFLDGTEMSLRTVFQELGWYAKYSGLKPNVAKCNAMWIGKKSFSEDKICPDIELTWGTKVKLLGILFTPDCQNIVEENIAKKKEALMRTIGMWQNRHLSLIGKIAVTKTLLLSQLTHVLSSLPSPNESTIKEITQMLFSFIWGSKRTPLKRIRLCQSMADNGLGMIDLKSYLMSLKMKWIKRFVAEKDKTWHLLAPERLQRQFVWNFGASALKRLLVDIHNPFWKDTVSAWITFSAAFYISEDMIPSENVFCSEYTKFKHTRYASWEREGVRFIGDLFEKNKLIDWTRFKKVFGIHCNYLDYSGLIHSLPKQFRRDQPEGWYLQRPLVPARLYFLLHGDSFSAFFANYSIKSARRNREREDIDRIKGKWMRDVNSFEESSVLYVKSSVIATKYIAFQYKLVMRILTTNTFLFIINRKENDKCTFCSNESETLVHLFLRCSHTNTFWLKIGNYLEMNGIEKPSERCKIFGEIDRPMLSHIVTVAKYVIYEARRREKRPNFTYFMSRLKVDYEIERNIAIKNDNMECFSKKWGKLDLERSLGEQN